MVLVFVVGVGGMSIGRTTIGIGTGTVVVLIDSLLILSYWNYIIFDSFEHSRRNLQHERRDHATTVFHNHKNNSSYSSSSESVNISTKKDTNGTNDTHHLQQTGIYTVLFLCKIVQVL